MRKFIVIVAVYIVGCTSIEKRCDYDMQMGRFNSYQECMAFRYRQYQDSEASLRRSSAGISDSLAGTGQHSYQPQEKTRRSCNGYSLAPLASYGCKNVCVNNEWVEVCSNGN